MGSVLIFVLNMADMYDRCCNTIEKYTGIQKMEEKFHGSFFLAFWKIIAMEYVNVHWLDI